MREREDPTLPPGPAVDSPPPLPCSTAWREGRQRTPHAGGWCARGSREVHRGEGLWRTARGPSAPPRPGACARGGPLEEQRRRGSEGAGTHTPTPPQPRRATGPWEEGRGGGFCRSPGISAGRTGGAGEGRAEPGWLPPCRCAADGRASVGRLSGGPGPAPGAYIRAGIAVPAMLVGLDPAPPPSMPALSGGAGGSGGAQSAELPATWLLSPLSAWLCPCSVLHLLLLPPDPAVAAAGPAAAAGTAGAAPGTRCQGC